MRSSESERPDDVNSLRRALELVRLDQEWEQQRRRLLLGGENGTRPTKGASVLALLCGLALAAFCFFAAFYLIPRSSGPQDNTIPLVIGIVAAFGGFISAIYIAFLAERYEKAQRSYERRRQELSGPRPGG